MKIITRFYKNNRVLIWTIIGTGTLFLLWWIISLLVNSTLFPGPQVVVPEFVAHLGKGDTYLAIGGTLIRLLISIALGFFFGILLGIFGGLSVGFRAFMRPFIIVFRTIPTAAVVFIIVALLKPMFAPTIIVFLIVFPILYESVVSGITNVDQSIVDALKIDGTNVRKAVFKIYLPLSWSYILLGLVSSIGLGMKVGIMSEILAGSDSANGLGKLIRDAATIADMKGVLSYSLIAIILIGLIDIGMYFLKKKLKKYAR